mgnify:CR=1 FL=1
MDNITTIPRKNCRQSNYELMRIVAMLMIIAFHLCRLYTPEVYERVFSLNQFFSIILGSWGLLGVDIFFLLSAYFSIDAKQFKTEKLCNIAILTALYGLCGLAIAVKWGGREFQLR